MTLARLSEKTRAHVSIYLLHNVPRFKELCITLTRVNYRFFERCASIGVRKPLTAMSQLRISYVRKTLTMGIDRMQQIGNVHHVRAMLEKNPPPLPKLVCHTQPFEEEQKVLRADPVIRRGAF